MITVEGFLTTLLEVAPPDAVAWCAQFAADPEDTQPGDWAGAPHQRDVAFHVNGSNAYYSIAAFVANATARNLTTALGASVVLCDDVGQKTSEAQVLAMLGEPSFKIQTSPTSQQWGYLLDRLVTNSELKPIHERLRALGLCDPSGNNLVRYGRLPGGVNNKRKYGPQPFPVHLVAGSWHPERRFNAQRILGKLTTATRGAEPQEEPDAELIERLRTGEGRHDALVKLAARYAGRGRKLPDIVHTLQAHMLADELRLGHWQQHFDDIPRIAESAVEKFAPDDAAFAMTDLGNAKRLAARHAEDWRWLPELGWMRFDGVRWARDAERKIGLVAAEVARGIYAEALAATDDTRRKALVAHALKSESRRALEAMEVLARPRVADLLERYDQQPFLMAVENGAVDLLTGELRTATRDDRLRLKAGVTFDPAATCPLWDRFLREIFAGDDELIAYVQRAAGYSMCGVNDEQVLFIAHGGGKNGKSTMIEVLSTLLGEYAQAVPADTLMLKRGDGGVPNDIARMTGVRFGPTVEVEDGKKLAESLVKRITGKDKISARFMRGEWFDFYPVIKLWIVTNHRPVITGTDDAIWRRIHLIPFNVTIAPERRDLRMKEKLLAEAAGIFNWMAAGFRAWRAEGLCAPRAVTDATDAYRTDMDTIGEFLRECCMLGAQHRERKTAVYAAYVRWCGESGYRDMSKKQFYEKMTLAHGLTAVSRDGYEVFPLRLAAVAAARRDEL